MIPVTLRENSILNKRDQEVLRKMYEKEGDRAWLPAAGDDPLDPERKRRVDCTYPELLEQPDKVKETITEEREQIRAAALTLCRRRINKIYLTGCGDSIAALQGAEYLLEELLQIPCRDMQALEFAYYGAGVLDENTLVIMLSSSGTTIRTMEAMMIARERGAQTLALTNSKGSPLMEESTCGLYIHASRKGWPTQSSTSAMAMVMQLGIDMADAMGRDRNVIEQFQKELDSIPELMREVTKACENQIRQWAAELFQKKMFLFSAGGPCSSSAFFGAAKIKEATPNYAITIPLEEYHHYNSQKAGDPLILIVPKGNGDYRAGETIKAAHVYGGSVYLITDNSEKELADGADRVLFLPEVSEYFSALIYSVPVQMLGYYISLEQYGFAERNQ